MVLIDSDMPNKAKVKGCASNQKSPHIIGFLKSLCVLGLIPCFSVYDNLWGGCNHHEGRKFQHQNSKGPIDEAFSEFLSI